MANTEPTLWIAHNAWQQMVSLAEELAPKETGGMLLGYAVGEEVVVTAVVGPGPNAIHKLFRFYPDGDYQQERLAGHYYATQGRETYLGDWHTHPQGPLRMSPLDRLTLTRIARDPSARAPRATMLILSDAGVWDAAAFRVQPGVPWPWRIGGLGVNLFVDEAG